MIKRKLESKIKELSKKLPVISITGPRQSGKTTLVKMCFPDYTYANLEMPDVRDLAKSDPRSFLTNYKNGLIIDEAQYIPELFSYIQGFVDESGKMGKYILTGSQNFLLLEKIAQSLAGRVGIFHLLPFSMNEISGSISLSNNYHTYIFKGLYPRIYDTKISPDQFYLSYIQTYLERDVRNIKNIANLSLFKKFLSLAAGRIGQLVNYASLANAVGVDIKTIQNWFSILEASFIVFFIRSYHKNYNKRLVKSPKMYFYDTGLACALLGIQNQHQIINHYFKGELFENFIISEINKYLVNEGKRPELYFWRDNTGNEIDCIIDEGMSHKIVEIKSSQTISLDFFKGLTYYQKLSGITADKSYLIYGGGINQNRSLGKVIGWQHIDMLFE